MPSVRRVDAPAKRLSRPLQMATSTTPRWTWATLLMLMRSTRLMDHVIAVESNGWGEEGKGNCDVEDEGKGNCDVGQARRLCCKRGGAGKLEDRGFVILVDVRSYLKAGYSLILIIIFELRATTFSSKTSSWSKSEYRARQNHYIIHSWEHGNMYCNWILIENQTGYVM